jgi:DNA-directed RNA polymerase subunit RPC12/RpoP
VVVQICLGRIADGGRAGQLLARYLAQSLFSNLVLLALTFSIFGLFAFGYRCPRCHASLINKAAWMLNGRQCVCPKCGVRVDEPMHSPENEK